MPAMTPTHLISVAMEIGDMLLENGAEIYRVEDSMRRICQAYGVDNAEILQFLPPYHHNPRR